MFYKKISEYLKNKYGEKVYKIPVNITSRCPNANGSLGGCAFCSREAVSSEMMPEDISVSEQLDCNIAYISKRYGANKFIAYFQSGTNTFMQPEELERYMNEVNRPDIAALSFSTRPDCVNEEMLEKMAEYNAKTGRDIELELGLQSVNYKTLKKIDRGHSLAEFIDAVLMIKKYGFDIGAHIILNLPWDDMEDEIEAAKLLSALKIDIVKAHSLYIAKNTKFAQWYQAGKFEICSLEEYVKRAAMFIAYLDPNIAVERLTARASKEDTLFCNYDRSWWVIMDMIQDYAERNGIYQGVYFDYLGGKQLKRL